MGTPDRTDGRLTPSGYVRRVRAELDRLPPGRVPLRAWAARAGVSPGRLAKVFRAELGVTMTAYLRRARVDRAAVLLAGNRMTLAAVAVAAGYHDQSHLARDFKRLTGVTPGQHRRLNRRAAGRGGGDPDRPPFPPRPHPGAGPG